MNQDWGKGRRLGDEGGGRGCIRRCFGAGRGLEWIGTGDRGGDWVTELEEEGALEGILGGRT